MSISQLVKINGFFCFLLLSLNSLASTSIADTLNTIEKFAGEFCKEVPLKGDNNELMLSGEAKAELNNLLKELVSLNVGGAVKYLDSNYNGLLQSQLLDALKVKDNCRLTIWKDLRLLILDQVEIKQGKYVKTSATPKNITEATTLSGNLPAGATNRKQLKLVKGDIVVFLPIEQAVDSLYFEMNVYQSETRQLSCKIGQWKGSSGSLGNGLLYEVRETGQYTFAISSMENTSGPWEIRVFPDNSFGLRGSCDQINS